MIEKLEELLERVEKATTANYNLETSISVALTPELAMRGISPNVTASIDAALALVERVLPGWDWLKKSEKVISLYRPLTEQEEIEKAWAVHHDGAGPNIPLAIISALLKALIAQEQQK